MREILEYLTRDEAGSGGGSSGSGAARSISLAVMDTDSTFTIYRLIDDLANQHETQVLKTK